MITRAQKVRLAIFVVTSATLLVGTILVLAGLKMTERRDLYTVRYRTSVSGLEVGAQVKYNGVRVGRVEAVKINPEDVAEVIVTLSLEAGTPIKADTKATLNSAGITGLRFIELTQGSAGSAMLKPGDTITAGDSLLDKLSDRAEVIADKAQEVLTHVGAMTNADNRAALASILKNVDAVTREAAGMITDNRANLARITESLARASERVDQTVAQLSEDAAMIMGDVRATLATLQGTVDPGQVRRVLASVNGLLSALRKKTEATNLPVLVAEAQRLAARARGLVEHLDTTILRSREDIYGSLGYLLDGMENFSEFTRIVRENPTLLFRGAKADE